MKTFKIYWLIPIIGLITFEDYLFWLYKKVIKYNNNLFLFYLLTLIYMLYNFLPFFFFIFYNVNYK